jgi:type I restriction enzyme S subunit
MKTIEIPFGRIVHEVDSRAREESEDLVLMSVSISRGLIPRSELTDKEPRADDLSIYKRCWQGDVVLNRMSAYQGALGLVHVDGMVSPDYAVLRPNAGLDARYLTYLMKSTWFISEMTSRLRGIGSPGATSVRTPRVNVDDLRDISIALPLMEEQRRIADFLDDQVTRIDQAIALRRAQIELVWESFGVWLEERVLNLPLVPLRRLTASITSGPRGWGDYVSDVGDRMFVRINNISGRGIAPNLEGAAWVSPQEDAESRRASLARGDVLVSITASIGDLAVAGGGMHGAAFSQHVARVRLHDPRIARALAWCASSRGSRERLMNAAFGGTKIGLNLQQVGDWEVPLVEDSQVDVFCFDVDQYFLEADEFHIFTKESILLLEERKRSLITALVTGQVDVTHARPITFAADASTSTRKMNSAHGIGEM